MQYQLLDRWTTLGTTVELESMDAFLEHQSRQSRLMISMVHVVILAVARALAGEDRTAPGLRTWTGHAR